MGLLCIWMSPAAVKASLPHDFNVSYSNTQVVLDCTELQCQTPSSLLLQSEVFSTYKSHCTFMPMVGMSPHRALFQGSMSDKEVFRQPGITSLLTPDTAIMVDMEVLVDNLVPWSVHYPAFLSKRTHVLEVDALKTQLIGHLRVHVERMIRGVNENKLFDNTIPLSISGNINQLFTVAVPKWTCGRETEISNLTCSYIYLFWGGWHELYFIKSGLGVSGGPWNNFKGPTACWLKYTMCGPAHNIS